RCYRDWSSDVCSSDLGLDAAAEPAGQVRRSSFPFARAVPRLPQPEGSEVEILRVRGIDDEGRDELGGIRLVQPVYRRDETGIARSEERRVGKDCRFSG